ncbi:MAG: nickel pincer cofactor biosynthesis protein LarC [Syntrophomonadaceae bacterium]|nr:nickel pincer cofactor biosynthesis protein LarC [Syntrophomonadaceae bacterium]
MNILYFDCFSGVSGDMLLGALAALGADLSLVEKELNQILPQPVALQVKPVVVLGIAASDVTVVNATSAAFTGIDELKSILEHSHLADDEKAAALKIFTRLAASEARVHGVPIEKVHFHELGTVDTLVDVIGFLLALRQLNVKTLYCSPLPMPRGFLNMAHGKYPLPAPATLELVKGLPCYGVDADIELVTPTGAAILGALCQGFGAFPSMTIREVGYGAGKSRRSDVPNLLRAVLGTEAQTQLKDEVIAVIETNIDDMSPEYFSYLFERFYEMEGALDLSVQSIVMKKNRPGFQVTCLVRPDCIRSFAELLLTETSTLGVRYRLESRLVQPWHMEEVTTPWGTAAVKVWKTRDGSIRIAPEYESCRALAVRAGLPLYQVVNQIISTYNR